MRLHQYRTEKFRRASILGAAAGLSFALFAPAAPAGEISSTDPNAMRARLVAVHDSQAVEAFRPHAEIVRAMVDCGITNLTGTVSARQGWRSLFLTNGVVATNEIIGIKVYSLPGPNSGTRPAVVAAVIEGLLDAGFSPSHIVVWDKEATDLRLAGFFDLADRYGVRVAGSAQAGYDEKTFYDTPLIGNLLWGDYEFGKSGPGVGRKSFVSKLVTRQMTRIINVTPLLNHNVAGVSGNLYSLASGSVDNFTRFEMAPDRLATAVPEIYNLPVLADRVVLSIVDALICQYEGGERGLLHYSATLDELRFSKDPVALDAISLKDLQRQRELASAPATRPTEQLYNWAALLQLGVNDPKRIRVDRVELR